MSGADREVVAKLGLESLVVVAGQTVEAPVQVANDGHALVGVAIETCFGDSAWAAQLGDLAGHTASPVFIVVLEAPVVPGRHDLVVRLSSASGPISEDRHPVHVVRDPVACGLGVRLSAGSSDDTEAALAGVGAVPDADGLLVVGEGDLDGAAGTELRTTLGRGGVGVVLAQPPGAAPDYPVPVTMDAIGTPWGTVFRFTTDHGAIPSLPRRAVLVAEDFTIPATATLSQVDGRPLPDTPVVIARTSVPDAVAGTVVGATAVGRGRLIFCQYHLSGPVRAGDVAARAVLVDLLRWATDRRPVMTVDRTAEPDGRNLRLYSWADEVAR